MEYILLKSQNQLMSSNTKHMKLDDICWLCDFNSIYTCSIQPTIFLFCIINKIFISRTLLPIWWIQHQITTFIQFCEFILFHKIDTVRNCLKFIFICILYRPVCQCDIFVTLYSTVVNNNIYMYMYMYALYNMSLNNIE